METTPSTGQLMAENERLRQEIHNVKRKLAMCEKTAEFLSNELIQEEERSTKNIDQISTQYEKKLASQKSLIELLKAAIAEQDNITKQCSSNIPAAKTPIVTSENTSSEEQLAWERKEAKYLEIIKLFQKNLKELRQDYTTELFKMLGLHEDVELVHKKLEYVQNYELIKTEEIIELRELLNTAQELNSKLTAELDGIPSKPDEKGNSLFQTVASHRIHLLKKFMQYKMRFYTVIAEHENCAKQLQELRNMHEQTKRLHEQCMNQIKDAKCDLQKFIEKNNDLNKQVETANSLSRYLENKLGANSADWVQQRILSNREHMQKLEAQVQIYQTRTREALQMHEFAVLTSWMWQMTVQHMKLQILSLQISSETHTSNDAEATTSGVRASDMKNHEKDSITKQEDSSIIVNDRENHEKNSLTKEEDSASSTKVNDRANHEKNSKDKDEDNHTQHARYPSDDAAYDTNRINIEATVSPTYSGELQESKKEQQQVLPEVTKKSIKAIDAVAMNKGRKKSLANKRKQKAKK